MEAGPYVVLRVTPSSSFGSPFSPGGGLAFGPSAQPQGVDIQVDEERSLTKNDLTDLRRDPAVQLVAPVIPTQLVRPTAVEEAAAPTESGFTWGVIATGAAQSPFTGKGVTVAVLDTGIDAQHPAFQGVQLVQKDFTGEGDMDGQGHGTHVAGTIFGRPIDGLRFGMAPGVERALIGKVLDSQGRGTTAQIYSAILWAAEEGAHVINMSLGLDFPGLVAWWIEHDLPADLATSRALESYRANLRLFDSLAALVRSRASMFQSTLIVAAAGNESKRDVNPDYEIVVSPPATADGIVSVGALQSRGEPHDQLTVADFSNTGANIAAPGVAIYSAWPGNSYRRINGTSMASPHVAGVAALWAQKLIEQRGRLSLNEFEAKLVGQASTNRLDPSVEALDIGAGLVQAPLN
ncbi:MAG TPA: S8 family serine peptidase [Anaerolineae bacterium]|nr:S8 family serine peptidase [Anaerolineae bacterium]